jgi:hypothetical protein
MCCWIFAYGTDGAELECKVKGKSKKVKVFYSDELVR